MQHIVRVLCKDTRTAAHWILELISILFWATLSLTRIDTPPQALLSAVLLDIVALITFHFDRLRSSSLLETDNGRVLDK